MSIPEGISFDDLKLHRLEGDVVGFEYDLFLRVWIACGYPAAVLYKPDNAEIFEFLARWYAEYIRYGGAGSAETDKLIAYLLSDKGPSIRILPI